MLTQIRNKIFAGNR